MTFHLRPFLAGVALAALAPVASAAYTTVNFDDLVGEANFGAPYAGLTFANNPGLFAWRHSDVNQAYGVPYDLSKSGDQSVSTVAFDDAGTIAPACDYGAYTTDANCRSQAITAASGFKFGGASFAALDGTTGDGVDPGLPVLVAFELWFQGTKVATTALTEVAFDLLAGSAFSDIASGYGGQVDTIYVLGDQGYFAMDDLLVDFSTGTVPAPATAALLLAAAMGWAGTRRRKQAA